MKFKITADLSGVHPAFFDTASTKAERALTDKIIKDTRPYVPFDTGTFSDATRLEGNVIVYAGPQSRYLYEGKVMIYPPTGSTYAPKYQHKEVKKKVVTNKDLVFQKTGHRLAQAHWIDASTEANGKKWDKFAEELIAKNV